MSRIENAILSTKKSTAVMDGKNSESTPYVEYSVLDDGSIREAEKIVGRHVEITCEFGNVGSGGIALVGFPIADDAKAHA